MRLQKHLPNYDYNRSIYLAKNCVQCLAERLLYSYTGEKFVDTITMWCLSKGAFFYNNICFVFHIHLIIHKVLSIPPQKCILNYFLPFFSYFTSEIHHVFHWTEAMPFYLVSPASVSFLSLISSLFRFISHTMVSKTFLVIKSDHIMAH